MTSPFRCIAALFVFVTIISFPLRGDVVLHWNSVLLNNIAATATNPPRASRAMAMMHCAVFDAVNGVYGTPYQPYAVAGSPPNGASANAAAAAAAHRVLVHLFPLQQTMLDSELAASLAGIPAGPRTKGVEWGRRCGDAIIAIRADDGANANVPYGPFPGPGFWSPTPPGFLPALLPGWGAVTPWTMHTGDQFRSAGPPALTSAEYAAAFNEVKLLGRFDSAARTAEQSEIALYWADNPGTATPPGHWQLIAQGVSRSRSLNRLENARLFALLGVAVADAAIVSWDNKYHYHHWRPVTGIQQADWDGNPNTIADPNWLPFIPTPPFPAYTSGHSTFSSASSKILELYFETNEIAFSSPSLHSDQPDVVRYFSSFSQAAEEAGISRIFGGIHWQYDNIDGLEAGRALGEHVMESVFWRIGDFTGDGAVTALDLVILISAMGWNPGHPADLNGNSFVDPDDLTILVQKMHPLIEPAH